MSRHDKLSFDKIFGGIEDFRGSYKSHPMTAGMEPRGLNLWEQQIALLKDENKLPPSYDIHNSLNLLYDSEMDTTNKSIIMAAQQYGFDPDGFRSGMPLQKHIFYLDPYVTCSWCNLICFVDAMAIRRQIALPREMGAKVSPETLPPCKRCNRGDCFYVGSHDFHHHINDRARYNRI